jgi:transposase-like protein
MPRRPRRNHTPAFKAKVALAALKGDAKLAESSVDTSNPATSGRRKSGHHADPRRLVRGTRCS